MAALVKLTLNLKVDYHFPLNSIIVIFTVALRRLEIFFYIQLLLKNWENKSYIERGEDQLLKNRGWVEKMGKTRNGELGQNH